MSITNFPMSMADVEALAALTTQQTQAQFDRLMAKSLEARKWLADFNIRNDQPVRQPKEPA